MNKEETTKKLLANFIREYLEVDDDEVDYNFIDEWLAKNLQQAIVIKSVCSHPNKDYVAGVFGGIYCQDCEEKLE